MDAELRPPAEDIASTFETLSTPPAAGTGRPVCRGTHQYGTATVERTYHAADGRLVAETAFLDRERTVDVLDECWLLSDGQVVHTGERVAPFCRAHHGSDPATDVAFCLSASPSDAGVDLGDVTSEFRPATEVTIEDGLPLRFTGSHAAGEARVERSFFVDGTGGHMRVRTVYVWDGDRLGSVTERRALIDDGEFVAVTGEPVGAFCRRTHLTAPEADLRFCTRLGREELPAPE